MQCDGDSKADVRYRIGIAQATFSSLSQIWKDHRLSQNMKIRLYSSSVCHTLTHVCEALDLTEGVQKIFRGFNNRCMHSISRQEYRESAINPQSDANDSEA